MPDFDPAPYLATERLSSAKTAALIGATTGIGAAAARLFASVGVARILVAGRDGARGEAVLSECRDAAAAADGVQGDLETRFIPADLSTRAGAIKCAKDVAEAAGTVDYLIMCQNGVPRLPLKLNADGDSPDFTVQALSRFLIPHALIQSGALAPGAVVLSVANVGQTLAGLSVDDLSLAAMVPTCRTTLGAWAALSARDSSVLDAFITEQVARYPEYRWFHVFPGLVASERFPYDAFPFPVGWVIWGLMHTPAARTPKQLANVVVYAALEPLNVENLSGHFLGPSMNRMAPGAWASDAGNRAALWAKLEAIYAAATAAQGQA